LWRLALNKDLQRRLRDELSAVGNPEPSLDELNALHLLENVVRETLRIDSPVPETIREATADAVLPLAQPITGVDGSVMTSIPLKKGSFIIEPFLAVHTNKKIWGEDAEEYNPDRFDRPNCPAEKIPGSYGNLLSFNGGARNCM
jgi:cytochrome P450